MNTGSLKSLKSSARSFFVPVSNQTSARSQEKRLVTTAKLCSSLAGISLALNIGCYGYRRYIMFCLFSICFEWACQDFYLATES